MSACPLYNLFSGEELAVAFDEKEFILDTHLSYPFISTSNVPLPVPPLIFERGRPAPMPTCHPALARRLTMSWALNTSSSHSISNVASHFSNKALEARSVDDMPTFTRSTCILGAP